MLIPDVNVIVAAFRPDHPHHQPALEFLEAARTGSETLGLSDFALASTVRLLTSARVFVNPDTTSAVLQFTDSLLQPPAQLVQPGSTHWQRFHDLCASMSLRANTIPDAYLAAIALEQAATLVTFDRGFVRYSGLRWRLLEAAQQRGPVTPLPTPALA